MSDVLTKWELLALCCWLIVLGFALGLIVYA